MKNLLLVLMVAVTQFSFTRDYERHEVRDIIKPIKAESKRISNLSEEEWRIEQEAINENIQKHSKFHKEIYSD